MKARIKTFEELKSQGADIGIDTIGGAGRYLMNHYMMVYLGREIDLYPDPEDKTYYNAELTGGYNWESWMFEEVKKMNRNGANDE